MNESKSVYEIHMEWVDKLKERSETVLQPKGKPSGRIYGYIKSQNPHKDAGAIFKCKDGKFGLFGDMGALYITDIDWEDLGLCDSKCWYEWIDENRENKKDKDKETEKDKDKEKNIKTAIAALDKSIEENDKMRTILTQTRNHLTDLLCQQQTR